MAYEIPYDSNYGEWYGQPQDVTRLSAILEQSLDEDGYPIGIITASWNMPDNGGTFVAQLSTDGTEYHIAETNIRQNSVVLVVEPNTDYYLKIITVLGSQQSSGVVSSLLSSGVTITPPTPTVVAVQGGMQINVGSVPFGYNAVISISDGTDTTVLYTTNMITIYNCDAGTYTVSTAYSNASNDVGASSSSVSVTVSELATADDYVEKTSADYIKSASVNAGGDTLTLTKGDDSTVTFQGGGGSYVLPIASANTLGGIKVGNNLSIDANGVLSAIGGGGGSGSGVTTTVLYENNSGFATGTITLADNWNNYDFIEFYIGDSLDGLKYSDSAFFSKQDFQLAYDNNSTRNIVIDGYHDTSKNKWQIFNVSGLNTLSCNNAQIVRTYKIYGIKISGGSGGSYTAGDGIDITNDTISLETASTTDIGGVKVGSGLSIDANGVLSATGGGSNQDVFTLSTHSIDKTFTCQNTEYLSDTTVSKEFIFKIQTNYKRCVYKEGSDLAICGIANVGGVAYGIFLSLSPNGVVSLHTNEGGDWIYDRIGSLGTIHDDVNNIDWYYSGNGQVGQPFSSIVSSPAPTKPIMSGTYSSIINAATQLLEDASPQVIEVPIKEDLFNPTNYTVTSGDTITDNTLKSLINGYRPIKINNETYYFIKLDSGTYYYKNSYNIITINSSWVMTITADSSGGGGGGGGGGNTIRCGTYTHGSTLNGYGDSTVTITFDSPMPDTNYTVSLTRSFTDAYWANVVATALNKTVNGFNIQMYNNGGNGTAQPPKFDWIAIHL